MNELNESNLMRNTLLYFLVLLMSLTLSSCSRSEGVIYPTPEQPEDKYHIPSDSHVDLYDKSPYVEKVTEKLTNFFREALL